MSGNAQFQGLVVHQEFSGFDAFEEGARGWKLDFIQLDRGQLRAGLMHLLTPTVVLSRVSLGRKIMQRGETPPGFRTFAYAATEMLDLKWRGREFGPDHLMMFPVGDGLESVSQPGFDVHVLSISEWLLERYAVARGLGSVNELFPPGDLVRMTLEGRLKLRRVSQAMLTAGVANSSVLSDWAFREQLEHDLVACLLEVVSKGQLEEGRHERLVRSRRLAFEQACELMSARAAEPVKVGEVERLTGVSSRTLRYAFEQALGMSPKAYLNSLRLNRVREDLLTGRRQTVGSAAKHWGFRHMGQFAKDYQKLFGERPSETAGGS